jgi:Protein of unknown function (DUF4238)
VPALAEGPLAKHLREIGEGKRPLPQTRARRHHFVPSFALAKFATPQKRDGVIYQLDTKTGKPQKTSPDASCFAEELYTQDDDGTPNRVLEAFFSIVENYAAQAFPRLVAEPLKLTTGDRQTIAYYLAFQYQRTPVAIEDSALGQQAMMAVMMGLQFANADAFRQRYREVLDAKASDGEIERFRLETMETLKSGDIVFRDPDLAVFQMMLRTADSLAESIATLIWVLIEASDGEFIASDRALSMHDPQPKFPWSGHAIRSSQEAQTTFPLSPRHSLGLIQGGPQIASTEANAKEVRIFNLRTYGWASQFIYGRTQAAVQRVRVQAKAHPGLVIRPRAPKTVILERADPNDPTVGVEHAKKGWPRGLWATGDDGVDYFCSYELVDPSDPGSVQGIISAEEAVQRAFNATPPPGTQHG